MLCQRGREVRSSRKTLVEQVVGDVALEERNELINCHPFQTYGRGSFMHHTNKLGTIGRLPHLLEIS